MQVKNEAFFILGKAKEFSPEEQKIVKEFARFACSNMDCVDPIVVHSDNKEVLRDIL